MQAANTARSKVRARVEHVFGDQKNGMGAGIVRTIGIVQLSKEMKGLRRPVERSAVAGRSGVWMRQAFDHCETLWFIVPRR